jgi:hypothetical protein
MKLLITEGRYARITVGLGPADRQDVDGRVQVVPDDVGPGWRVDQDRIGARYEHLAAAYERARARLRPAAAFTIGGRAGGKTGRQFLAPWELLGPGVWWAPVGTPPPGWVDVDDLTTEFWDEVEDDSARRYWLNDVIFGAQRPVEAGNRGPS